MFAAFLPFEIAKKLFIHPEICLAGSGALSGKKQKKLMTNRLLSVLITQVQTYYH